MREKFLLFSTDAQADLIAAALKEMGVPRAIVLGHSWGTLVALALAVRYPQEVQALVLAPAIITRKARADMVILSPPAILIGDLFSHTLSPLLNRLVWPLLLRKIFRSESSSGEIQRLSEKRWLYDHPRSEPVLLNRLS